MKTETYIDHEGRKVEESLDEETGKVQAFGGYGEAFQLDPELIPS